MSRGLGDVYKRQGDHTIAWDDVAVHAEVTAPVFHKPVHLLEAALVEEHFEPLSGRHFTAGMLGLDAGLTATDLDFGLAGTEVFQALLSGRHGLTYARRLGVGL